MVPRFVKYRVSHNTVSTIVFWISQLSRALEIPSWTFFNSPFSVDFRNIQYFIIRWNIDWDIGKIPQGGDFKSQHFVFIIWWSTSPLIRSHEHSWTLISTHELSQALIRIMLWWHERSWVQMSSDDLMAAYSWLLLNSHECSLLHGMNVHGWWCVLMDNQDHSWLLLAAFEC